MSLPSMAKLYGINYKSSSSLVSLLVFYLIGVDVTHTYTHTHTHTHTHKGSLTFTNNKIIAINYSLNCKNIYPHQC